MSKAATESTIEQILGKDLAQRIRDYVSHLPEEEMIEEYFSLLRSLKYKTDYYNDLHEHDVITEQELRNLERQVKTSEFAVQCFQERFPQFKGTRRALTLCRGYGLRECLVSNDPTFTTVWGNFPPRCNGADGRQALGENN